MHDNPFHMCFRCLRLQIKRNSPSSFRNSSLSVPLAVPRIWLSILIPVVLSYSHRGSVLLRKPALTDQRETWIVTMFLAWTSAHAVL